MEQENGTVPIKAGLDVFWSTFVRTWVPQIVGSLAGFWGSLGISATAELDEAATVLLTSVLTPIAGGVWYLGARLLELFVTPKFGWLLGSTRRPVATEKADGDIKVETPEVVTAIVAEDSRIAPNTQ